MKAIGEHYSLPMISVVEAITPELDEGRMKWEEYSTDSAHPNDYGHRNIRTNQLTQCKKGKVV